MFWRIVRQSWRRNPRRRLLAVLTVFFLLLGARFFLSRVGELVDEL